MAQQTQIGRVAEAWAGFLAAFPTIRALADATPADVLRAWRGLGYNRRALNLWRAARVVVDEHGGELPRDVAALERLPGIGPYTARAVAAIAFGMPVGAVDTNVRRVLARVARRDRATAFAPGELQRVADASVPRDRPADWTHALMDVGATFCRPTRAGCERVPGEAVVPLRRSGAAEPCGPTPTPAGDAGRRRSRRRRAGSAAGSSTGSATRAPAGSSFDGAIGAHDRRGGRGALGDLAAEGLVERDPADPRLGPAPDRERRPRRGLGLAVMADPTRRPPASDSLAEPPLPADDPTLFELDLRGAARRAGRRPRRGRR